MADNSLIEWTDATWNPVTGCSVVSPGCTNCYAMKLAGGRLRHHPTRTGLTVETKAGPVWNGQVRFNETQLLEPLRWARPRMIFVCAHGDLFHESVPDEWIDRVFAVMALCPQHTFQVLTKRPERMRTYLDDPVADRRIHGLACDMVLDQQLRVVLIHDRELEHRAPPGRRIYLDLWPLPNVWLGTSVEDQRRADERIPHLLQTPAAVRFVSAEPLLGPMDLTVLRPAPEARLFGFEFLNALHGVWGREPDNNDPDLLEGLPPERRLRVDWVIVGGESGAGARAMHPNWARSLRDQCAAAAVPFFFKQWGGWAPVSHMSEAQVDSCYLPAPASDPEATRRQRIRSLVLHADSWAHSPVEPGAFLAGTAAMTMFEIGKHAAGRLLDDVEHNGMPVGP